MNMTGDSARLGTGLNPEIAGEAPYRISASDLADFLNDNDVPEDLDRKLRGLLEQIKIDGGRRRFVIEIEGGQ